MLTKKQTLENAWKAMKQRCNNPLNPGYDNYGGRGIGYSKEWEQFAQFYSDMEDTWIRGLSLDRKENNEDYSKENCKWSTRAQQNENKRRNVNQKVTPEMADEIFELYHGKSMKQADIAAHFGIDQTTVSTVVCGKRSYKHHAR